MAEIYEFNQNADTYAELGRAAIAEGDNERGVMLLNRALEMSPAHFKASLYLGKVYEAAEEYRIAIKVYMRALTKTTPLLMLKIAFCFLSEGDFEEANYYIDLFDSSEPADGYDFATVFEPLDEDEIEELGEMLGADSCDDDDWEDDDDEDDEDETDNGKFHIVGEDDTDEMFKDLPIGLIHDLISDGEDQSALKILEKVAEDSPQRTTAYHIMFAIYTSNGQYDRIIEEGTRLLKKSRDEGVLAAMAGAYLMTGDRAEAEKFARELLDKDPQNYRYIKSFMLPLAEAGDHKQNVEFFTYLFNMRSDLLLPGMLLAEALFNDGHTADAIEKMKRVQALFGKYSDAAFYVKYFSDAANHKRTIDYDLHIPESETAAQMKVLEKAHDEYLHEFDSAKLRKKLLYDAEFVAAIKAGLRSSHPDNARSAIFIIEQLADLGEMPLDIIKEYLSEPFLNPVITAFLLTLLLSYQTNVDIPVVFVCKWQETNIMYPTKVFHSLPSVFVAAYRTVFIENLLKGTNIRETSMKLSNILEPLKHFREELKKRQLQGKPLTAALQVVFVHGGYGIPATDEEITEAAQSFSTKRPSVIKYLNILEELVKIDIADD
ncbi:MAG: tetratricopeptide repeat protein [Clostridiaceae bacterium]|jgi:tetratricopeptide (TPR) repeat protein|nr:tetratricopeptide repeat protein [Clostridiaceae bacterium]